MATAKKKTAATMKTAKKTRPKRKHRVLKRRFGRGEWEARQYRRGLNYFVQEASVKLASSGRLSLQQAQKAAETLCSSLVDAGWFNEDPGVWFTREGGHLRKTKTQPGSLR